MKQLPDDPIIECMMRTGYPPWMQDYRYIEDDYFAEEISIPMYPDEEDYENEDDLDD